MKKSLLHLVVFSVLFIIACTPDKKTANNKLLFAKNNLVAWCIVPFDSMDRTPEDRAMMLHDLRIKHLAYDWRAKHLSSFPYEIRALKNLNIGLKSVWLWIDPDSTQSLIDSANQAVFDMVKQGRVKTDFWVGFANRYFDGLSDEQKLIKAVEAVKVIEEKAKEIGCTISLYNHGDWFGEPLNQIRIIEKTGSKEIGIVYNFHHAHSQIKEFPTLLQKMITSSVPSPLMSFKEAEPKI